MARDSWAGHLRREREAAAARAEALRLAPLCRHCGKTELGHKPEFQAGAFGPPQKVDRVQLRVPCFGWREHFEPEGLANG
jgi:hypothetical protein